MNQPTELSLDTLTDERVRKAFAYWDSARQGRTMPMRSAIDPVDLRFCLGWICMIDVFHEAPRRYRYRVDGSNLAYLTGFDLTGKYVDQIESSEYRQLAKFVYDRVVEARAPLFLGNMEDWLERGFYMESVALPLSDDGEMVTSLMEVVCPAKVLSLSEGRNSLGEASLAYVARTHRAF